MSIFKLTIIVIVSLALGVAGTYYWFSYNAPSTEDPQQFSDAIQKDLEPTVDQPVVTPLPANILKDLEPTVKR